MQPKSKIPLMEKSSYTVDELRASVEEGTCQIESGRYYTDAQVDRMYNKSRTFRIYQNLI